MHTDVSAGAVKFFESKDFLSEFPHTSPKSFCATFVLEFSPTKIMKIFFNATFLQALGTILLRQTRLGAILLGFSGIFPRFLGILPRFSGLFPGFLGKPKLLDVHLAPLYPLVQLHTSYETLMSIL